MSLDVSLVKQMPVAVFSRNITHNLAGMAAEAGIYSHLWRPDEIGIAKAESLIEPLTEGLQRLRGDREKYIKFNPSNGWGSYDGLVMAVEEYLAACREHPDATVQVCR